MSWKDFLTDDERAELEADLAAKREVAQPIVDKYNKTYRRLKTRCDARMRRARENQRGTIIFKSEQ